VLQSGVGGIYCVKNQLATPVKKTYSRRIYFSTAQTP